MRRGDLVTITLQGDFGKPRPALVVQSDLFNADHATISVLPITSSIVGVPVFRITLEPSAANGLRKVSQIMVDKIVSMKREKIGEAFGRLDDETMLRVNRALTVWLGVA
ncbi:MAG: type II toxin-antitoxin system PemK/MazF family toxin [Candidatus Contendobacter sp.]|nr:type II toxin-antitoxin system PemK/MazF family toxin [Candidatus Contendobacter sp.]MDS4058183.1 type II toxin-antitoxin system PemK/MazF family toxin [Candidatus Contendobacter sp.]